MVNDSTPVAVDGFGRVGSFRYVIAEDRWEWSDAVARMHGYEPGEVEPTTALVLSHKHPEDKPAVSEVIAHVQRAGAAFSSRHRIIDTAGREHLVVVVGDQLFDETGGVIGTTGFYIDLTEAYHAELQKSVTAAVAEVQERREVIHQAVGIIRMAYGVSTERAFDVIKWRSQQTNVKLRDIAVQFVEDLAAQPMDPRDRGQVDRTLLTAHERVNGAHDHELIRDGSADVLGE